jgi:putative two-component system response regulator
MILEDELLNSNIMVVDDEPANVQLLLRALENEGFTSIKSTTDPREAVDMYQSFSPDLVLLDLRMPFLDGFQVMEKLKEFEEGSYIPVLVLTAQSDDETQMRALNAGAKDFLGKPFNLTEVVCRIRNMLEVRLLHNKIKDHNKTLELEVKKRTAELVSANEKLKRGNEEVIKRLGRAAEYRDNETGNHVLRMSHFSMKLGEAVGMSEADCRTLLLASPMHDLGKIGIPDNILLKPARLNEEEWEIMKTHAAIGGEILSGGTEELITMAEVIALTHQEKWDGSGYPNGLQGKDIPLVGRITAICDVFDALTSERPYKKAWSIEETVNLMKSESGKHFDPELIPLFLEILPEVLKIKDQFSESVA